MTNDGRKVLHVVDEETRFSAARFFEEENTNTIWKTVIECRVKIYIGLPNHILVDQGSSLGSFFVHMTFLRGVDVKNTGIESHNSPGSGQWYHQHLRLTYRETLVRYLNAEPSLALAVFVETLKDTLGPEGNVPSALVFGEITLPYTLSKQKRQRLTTDERAAIIALARKNERDHGSNAHK